MSCQSSATLLIDLMFRLFDDDRTGKVSYKNLKRVFSECAPNATDEDIQGLVDQYDQDGDGELNKDEFSVAIDIMALAFLFFDDDQTRKVSFKNVKRVCAMAEFEVSDEDIRGIFDEHDKDGDGELKEDEFRCACGGGLLIHETMALVELFGEKLLTKDGEKSTTEALAGMDTILIYFSAHWCPPCRGYTPELSAAYADSGKKDKTAIVFVSSDQTEDAFNEYYGEMSFFAMPFANRAGKDAISAKYGVRGIPTLLQLDGAGELKDGNVRGRHGEFL